MSKDKCFKQCKLNYILINKEGISIKGAIIGFGTIAMGHTDAYFKMENIKIVAVVDPLPERRKYAKEILPNIRTYDSIHDMFFNENLDFIDICTPPNTHFDYIRIGLLKGSHIICEKPLLLFTNQYKEICSLAKSVNKIIYPSHNYKFAPVLKQIKGIVHSEQFGQVINGHFRILRSGHAVGVSEWNPHWRRDPKISGGGILRDHGPHSIYIASDMCGQVPTAVSCITGNLKTDRYVDTEDTALLTIQFDNNIQFIIDISWASTFRKSYYAISGSIENIIVENDELIHTTKNGKIIRSTISSGFNDPSHKAWFYDMFVDFINIVATPTKQLPLLREAFITSLVIEQAYISADNGGKLIDLPYIPENFLVVNTF